MRYQFLVDTPLLPLSRVEYINVHIHLYSEARDIREGALAVEIVLNNEFCCVLSWSSAITVLLLVCAEIYTTNIFIAACLIDCRIFVLKDLHLLITQSTKILFFFDVCKSWKYFFLVLISSLDGTFHIFSDKSVNYLNQFDKF